MNPVYDIETGLYLTTEEPVEPFSAVLSLPGNKSYLTNDWKVLP